MSKIKDQINDKNLKVLFQKWKLYDTIAAVLSFIGLVLAIAYYECDRNLAKF